MPVFQIHHTTKYLYDRPIKESINEIRIYPYTCPEQELLSHEIFITENPEIFVFTDYWNNKTGNFNLLSPHQSLIIESRLLVRTTAPVQLKFNFNANFSKLEADVQNKLSLIELSNIDPIHSQSLIDEIAKKLLKKTKSVVLAIEYCCEYIYKNYNYIKGITTIETTVDEILEHKSGVCQDFAHLMLQVLRTLHIPARYVSGYICPNKNGMRGEGATHAWVEAWIPGFGWAGIDPTNNVWVTNKHIKLAVGRNFNDCSPVKGSFKGPAYQQLSVFVSVSYEDGQTFEAFNNVKIQLNKSNEGLPVISHNIAGQQ